MKQEWNSSNNNKTNSIKLKKVMKTKIGELKNNKTTYNEIKQESNSNKILEWYSNETVIKQTLRWIEQEWNSNKTYILQE